MHQRLCRRPQLFMRRTPCRMGKGLCRPSRPLQTRISCLLVRPGSAVQRTAGRPVGTRQTHCPADGADRADGCVVPPAAPSYILTHRGWLAILPWVCFETAPVGAEARPRHRLLQRKVNDSDPAVQARERPALWRLLCVPLASLPPAPRGYQRRHPRLRQRTTGCREGNPEHRSPDRSANASQRGHGPARQPPGRYAD